MKEGNDLPKSNSDIEVPESVTRGTEDRKMRVKPDTRCNWLMLANDGGER